MSTARFMIVAISDQNGDSFRPGEAALRAENAQILAAFLETIY
jgi:hypothetical protein